MRSKTLDYRAVVIDSLLDSLISHKSDVYNVSLKSILTNYKHYRNIKNR